MNRLRKLLKLSWQERLLLLITLSLMLAIRLGLRLLSFRRLLQFLTILRQASFPIYRGTDGVRRTVWAIEISSRYMPGGVKCLARALTTQVLLGWHGYLSDLKIGVAKSDSGHLEAHAWVEYQNQVVIGNLYDLVRYIPLLSIESFQQ